MPGPLMSALWTPGRAGVSQGFLWQSPALPSRVLLHRSLARRLRRVPVGMVGRRFRFESRPESAQVGLLHEGWDPLAKGCAYCTKAPPTRSTPNPPPVAPHPRAVHPGDAGSHRTDRVSPSGRLKPQLSRPAGAPTLSPSPRSYLMSRARGLRVRPRDLTYDRAALHRDEAWRVSRSARMRSSSSGISGPRVGPRGPS